MTQEAETAGLGRGWPGVPRVATKAPPHPEHVPTPELRAQCRTLAKVLSKHQTARVMGLNFRTLVKYYNEDFEIGQANCIAAVGSKVITQAMEGCRPSQALYMRTHGWKTSDEQGHYDLPPSAGVLPERALMELDDDDLNALERIARKLNRHHQGEPGGEPHGLIEGDYTEIDEAGD